jgi:dolichol kinase
VKPSVPDPKKLERELAAAAERVRGEAQAAAERVRGEAQAAAGRVREEALAAAGRVKDETPRKAIHLSSILFPLAILHMPLAWSRRVMILIAVALLIVDLVKIHQPKMRTYFTAVFGHLVRRHELAGITSSTYLVISALLATYLFDRNVAGAALVYLIVGDTLAAMVGKAWGRTRIFGKTLEGFLAGFVASFLAAWLLVPGIPPATLAAGALAAAVVEILPIPVDDNFRIPLVGGLVLQLLA